MSVGLEAEIFFNSVQTGPQFFLFGISKCTLPGGGDEGSVGVGGDAGVWPPPQPPHLPLALLHVPPLARPLHTL